MVDSRGEDLDQLREQLRHIDERLQGVLAKKHQLLTNYIDPDPELKNQIPSAYHTSESHEKPAVYHEFVYNEIQDKRTPHIFSDPDLDPWTTLETREGDCKRKTVLLASLLQDEGFPVRFVLLSNEETESDDNHVLLEFSYGHELSDSEFTDAAAMTAAYHIHSESEYQFENFKAEIDDQNRLWIVSDPTLSPRVGSIGVLEERGYIQNNPDQKFEFTWDTPVYYHYP